MNAGDRLASQVCQTQVMVIRPSDSVDLTCGGLPMVALDTAPSTPLPAATGLSTGTLLGKRYTSAADEAFEVLVTQAGTGTLGDGPAPLVLKEAKALPSSD